MTCVNGPARNGTVLLVFLLTGAAAAWIHLLACRVGVAERTVLAEGISPVTAVLVLLVAGAVLGALLRQEKAEPGTLARAAREAWPLGGLVLIALHASLAEMPSFAEVVIAPGLTGLAAWRIAGPLPGPPGLRGRGPGTVVLGAAVVLGVGFYVHAVGLLDDLALGFSDVGDYAVRIENTLRGRFMKSFVYPNQAPFFDHWNPGLLLLVPLDAALRSVVPGARFFQLVQAAALAACAPLAFGLARRRLHDSRTAALVALAFVAAPALTHLNVAYSYGFHPVTLALPLLIGACWAGAARRTKTAALLVVIAWSFEETVPIATFGAGLALAFGRTTRRHGAVLAGASLGYFLLVTKVVLPLVNGEPYYQLGKYAHLGSGMGGIALSPVLRPRAFWGTLLDGATLGFLATLLVPWLLLPARRPAWLVATAPILVFACLRDEPHVKSIVLQYHTLVLPWLLVGFVEGVRVRRGRRALALGALAAALASALLFGDEPFGRARRPWPRREGRSADVQAVLASIAPTESVAAPQRIAAHLIASHPEVGIVRDGFLPEAAVYVIDLDDGWGLARTTRAHRHARDLRARGFGTRLARRELLVLARDQKIHEPLRDARPALASFPGFSLSLLAREEKDGRLALRWRLEGKTDADLGAIPLGADGRVAGEVLPVGGAARPTYERAPGEAFDEERRAVAPVVDFAFFDYLDLDRRGLDVVDVLPAPR